MRFNSVRFSAALAIGMLSFAVSGPSAWAAAADTSTPGGGNCAQYMAPSKTEGGKKVGQEQCYMQDWGIVDVDGKYHRIEIGVTGTLSGYVVKEPPRANHFSSLPDFQFPQFGNTSPRFHGILRYMAERGSSMTLIYPETTWNGKLWVFVHGSGGSFRDGSMKPWDQIVDVTLPFSDVTRYEQAALAKGYAIVRPRRNAAILTPGDYEAVLDDGTVWPDQNISLVPEYNLDMVRLAGNLLKDRLGKKPTRNYWYGHSGGAYQGLAINYTSSLTADLLKDADGKNLIDGFIDDDPGIGLFLPVLLKNGQDVLYRTPEQKASFIKTVVIAHQAYPLDYSTQPEKMGINNLLEIESPNALTNKRTTARLMRDKGITNYRMYEVRGVSHGGGEGWALGKIGGTEILNLSRMLDGVMDLVDNWVEKGVDPVPTHSDMPGLAADKAVALPEVACPLGKYYAYPSLRGVGGVGSTGFAEFDGTSMEPFDGLSRFVDMNDNGKRDKRESVTEAWRRLGLLKAGETFNRNTYVACTEKTTAALNKEGLITQRGATLYIQEAKVKQLPQ